MKKGFTVPEKSQEGYLSCGVPGSVAGLLLALERYGTLNRDKNLRPAIELAVKGMKVSTSITDDLKSSLARITRYKSTCRVFLKGGEPYRAGDTLFQLDLAATLKRIVLQWKRWFLQRITADLIIAEMQTWEWIDFV